MPQGEPEMKGHPDIPQNDAKMNAQQAANFFMGDYEKDKMRRLEKMIETYQEAHRNDLKKITQLEAERDALVLRVGICEWKYDEIMDVWHTSCGNAWQFNSDGPKENECAYCMYCGGVIEILSLPEATRKEIDETKRFIYWNGEYWKQDANGELTYKMPIVEIERRLNATEALSAEDALEMRRDYTEGYEPWYWLTEYARILGGE